MAAGDSLIVTDGTDSFYGSNKVFQYVYNVNSFAKITAFSSSAANAKKMLLTREARYSGLLDKLVMAEGDIAAAFAEATTWVAVNADESTLLEQVAAAGKAGVKRAFIHLEASSAPSLDIGTLTSALAASGMAYTLMRTGELAKAGAGGGLYLSDLDLPACDEVPKEDVYRFLAEALTIDEAEGRAFSLCASADASQLKAMRMQGCTRRDEAVALLAGKITEKPPEEAVETAEDAAEKAKAKEKEEEDRAAEILRKQKAAAQRGKERAEFAAKQEEQRQKERAELAAKYKSISENADKRKDGDDDETNSNGSDDDNSGGGGGGSPDKTGGDDGGLAVM